MVGPPYHSYPNNGIKVLRNAILTAFGQRVELYGAPAHQFRYPAYFTWNLENAV
jgi:hypothetical protein